MRVIIAILAALVILAALAFSAPRAEKIDFSGTWLGKTDIPNAGPDDLTLVLKKEKEGYSGTFVDTLQVVVPETQILNAKVEGSVLTFTLPLADGMSVACKLTLEGDKMTGSWEHPEGDTGALVFEKKK